MKIYMEELQIIKYFILVTIKIQNYVIQKMIKMKYVIILKPTMNVMFVKMTRFQH